MKLIFSGSGGQGLMFIGKLLANLAMERYRHVTFFPSYGAEVRGGTSNCQVTLSADPIATPLVEHADVQVLMNQPSVDRFLPSLALDGQAFVNSTMASANGNNTVLVPATQMANDLGAVQSANVVIFGALLSQHPIIDRQTALAGIAAVSSAKGDKAVAMNKEAFEQGWNFLSP